MSPHWLKSKPLNRHADWEVSNPKHPSPSCVLIHAVRPENAGLNDFVEPIWMIETTMTLDYAVMECVQDDFKLRQKKRRGTSVYRTTTDFCPIVADALTRLLTLSFQVNGVLSAQLPSVSRPPREFKKLRDCTLEGLTLSWRQNNDHRRIFAFAWTVVGWWRNSVPLSLLHNKLQGWNGYRLKCHDDVARQITLFNRYITTLDAKKTRTYGQGAMMKTHGDLCSALQKPPRLLRRRNYRMKNKSAPDASATISMNAKDELQLYWRIYTPAWLPRRPQQRTGDRLSAWLRLHLIFKMRSTTSCKLQWWNSDCSFRTTNADDGVPKWARGYKNVGYSTFVGPKDSSSHKKVEVIV